MLNVLKAVLDLIPSIIRIVEAILTIILRHKKSNRPGKD